MTFARARTRLFAAVAVVGVLALAAGCSTGSLTAETTVTSLVQADRRAGLR